MGPWPSRSESFCPLLVDEAGPDSRGGLLVDEARARAQAVLNLAPEPLCVAMGPGPSSGQGCVPAQVVAWPKVSQIWCLQVGRWQ